MSSENNNADELGKIREKIKEADEDQNLNLNVNLTIDKSVIAAFKKADRKELRKEEKRLRMESYTEDQLCPKFYGFAEELMNAITHGIGALLAIAGVVVLIVQAALYANTTAIVSVTIYGLSLILLYTMSTIYHSVTNRRSKYYLRICDHSSIFLLIAGTYTPLMVYGVGGKLGYILTAIVWLVGIIGLICNIIDLKKYEKFSMLCYIVMGWCVIFVIKPVVAMLPSISLWLLVAGGIAYTVGIIFYKWRKPYMHAIWHLFVLAGSIFHYFAILYMININLLG